MTTLEADPMKMSEDERQCLSESRGGSAMSFLFLVIARVAIWEEQFTAFQDKKRVQHDDWEELSSEYNEQAKHHGFQDRTATQIENKIRNLKDSYKKAKDESTRSGAGNNKENNFPYYEVFNRLFSGKEALQSKTHT